MVVSVVVIVALAQLVAVVAVVVVVVVVVVVISVQQDHPMNQGKTLPEGVLNVYIINSTFK